MKILICDDHKLVSEPLRNMLLQLVSAETIDIAGTGSETLEMLKHTAYNVVLLDLRLPDFSGIDVLKRIKEKYKACHVIIVSMTPETEYGVHAMKLGASGYIEKSAPPEILLLAIQLAMNGRTFFSERTLDAFAHYKENVHKTKHEQLPYIEFSIMLKIAAGKKQKEIALFHNISPKTVATHKARIMKKLNFKTEADMIRYCSENKL